MFIHRLLDMLAPRECVVCRKRLSANEEHICLACQMVLPYTGMQAHPEDNVMARHFYGQFQIERAMALLRYLPRSNMARIIYSIKYGANEDLALWLGSWAARVAGPDFFSGIDGITYVPLTRRRQLWRGYNQSRLLAIGIGRQTALPVLDGVLRRNSFTGSQTQRMHEERREAVQEAFSLAAPDKVRGRHVLLVDDVMTTGSTLIECGRQLSRAGDVRISIITLGYTSQR